MHEVVLSLGAEMLVLGKLARTVAAGRKALQACLDSGAAAERFCEDGQGARWAGAIWCARRGSTSNGRPSCCRSHAAARRASSPAIDTRRVGLAVVVLGGGRTRPQDAVDHAVGLTVAGRPRRAPSAPIGRSPSSTPAPTSQLNLRPPRCCAAYRIGGRASPVGPDRQRPGRPALDPYGTGHETGLSGGCWRRSGRCDPDLRDRVTAQPQLVSPEWLSERLDDDSLRIVDATVILRLDPEGGDATLESGLAAWCEGHIPGASFADLMQLSDPDAGLPFMLPSPEAFADGVSSLGIGSGTHVVVYDAREGMWAARLWWMLRAFGFDTVSVLDGGLTAWRARRPPMLDRLARAPASALRGPLPARAGRRPRGRRSPRGRRLCLPRQRAVARIVPRRGDRSAHRRAGRIAGSVNVPTDALLDAQTNRFLPVERIRERFEGVGALDPDRPVVTYCGGGIAAAMDAFAAVALGTRRRRRLRRVAGRLGGRPEPSAQTG